MEPTTTSARLSPKFFFFSLGVLATLIASVSSFLVLFFETLNQKFPDALNAVYQYGYPSYNYDSIRGAIATLIIVFPVYLVLSYFWRKTSQGELLSWDITIRKWMIYLILFVAAVVIIVDLVTLVRYFVSGEITVRFIFKILGTLVVAKLIGWYYIFEMNPKVGFNIPLPKVLAAVSSLFVLGLIIWSFTLIGSPKMQRALRFDERRIQDLQSIQWQVINYWQQKEKLPEKLSDLADPISSYVIPVDPEINAGKVYEYTPKEKLSFELCATFSEAMPKGWVEYGTGGVSPMPFGGRDVAVSSYPYPGGGVNESWDHQAGRTCFTRTIDPDLYPPYQKQ
jgi:hypothetical protein